MTDFGFAGADPPADCATPERHAGTVKINPSVRYDWGSTPTTPANNPGCPGPILAGRAENRVFRTVKPVLPSLPKSGGTVIFAWNGDSALLY